MSFLENAKSRGIVPGLENVAKIAQRLDNPQDKPQNIIHIAGTNGKGSVGAFIESALLSAGYTVGRFSSPAVFSDFEVIKKNGREISKKEYTSLLKRIENASDGVLPTAFEVETLIAFEFIKDCDFAVIEAGMGGRLDATNIINARKTSVLTSISLDHTAFLGDTLLQIASEKCGIITGKAISAPQAAECEEIIKNYDVTFSAVPQNIRFNGTHQVFDCGDMKDIEISLSGTFQPTNASLATEVLRAFGISDEHIRNGLKSTVWRGRFDIIRNNPLLIADGAHNAAAFYELKKTLDLYFPNTKFNFITGVLKDKDYKTAAKLFSSMAHTVYTITPDNPRALNNTEYAEEFKKYGADTKAVTLKQAIKSIDKATVAFGSLSFMKQLYKEVGNG